MKSTSDNKFKLYSFSKCKFFEIVRVPTSRAMRVFNSNNIIRHHRYHAEVAHEWISHLPGDFKQKLVASFLADDPCSTKDLIKKHHMDMFRLSATETAAIKTFVRLTDKHVHKLSRVLAFYTGGLRIPAPKDESIKLKEEYLSK